MGKYIANSLAHIRAQYHSIFRNQPLYPLVIDSSLGTPGPGDYEEEHDIGVEEPAVGLNWNV